MAQDIITTQHLIDVLTKKLGASTVVSFSFSVFRQESLFCSLQFSFFPHFLVLSLPWMNQMGVAQSLVSLLSLAHLKV